MTITFYIEIREPGSFLSGKKVLSGLPLTTLVLRLLSPVTGFKFHSSCMSNGVSEYERQARFLSESFCLFFVLNIINVGLLNSSLATVQTA